MIAPRAAFGDALAEAGDWNPRLVVLDADVGRSTQTYRFEQRHPDRFYQIGVAEQNMMGIAAGMATTGWLPFVSSFAVFVAKRACDQVRVSIAYPRLNVKINGTPWVELPGLEKEVPERKLLHEVTFRDCALDKRIM